MRRADLLNGIKRFLRSPLELWTCGACGDLMAVGPLRCMNCGWRPGAGGEAPRSGAGAEGRPTEAPSSGSCAGRARETRRARPRPPASAGRPAETLGAAVAVGVLVGLFWGAREAATPGDHVDPDSVWPESGTDVHLALLGTPAPPPATRGSPPVHGWAGGGGPDAAAGEDDHLAVDRDLSGLEERLRQLDRLDAEDLEDDEEEDDWDEDVEDWDEWDDDEDETDEDSEDDWDPNRLDEGGEDEWSV